MARPTKECNAVKTLLQFIGEDPNREGLKRTPERFVQFLKEATSGYQLEPGRVLKTTFGQTDLDAPIYHGIVVLKGIDFNSLCEHHLLPFVGQAHVAYIPNSYQPRIVGISKLARLVDLYAKRLQNQERMTEQIAQAIQKELKPSGVIVVIEATHCCMCVRGVKKPNAVMMTSSISGTFKESPETRTEVLNLILK